MNAMENELSRTKQDRDKNKLLVKQSKEIIEEMRSRTQSDMDEAKRLAGEQKDMITAVQEDMRKKESLWKKERGQLEEEKKMLEGRIDEEGSKTREALNKVD